MKLKKGALGIGLLLALGATVLMVLLPVSVNLYIAYVCCLLGIGMMIAGAVFFDKRDVPGSFAQLIQAAWFLPASLTVSLIVLITQIFFPVSPLLHGAVQFLLCLLAAIRLVAVGAGKGYIQEREAEIAEKTGRIADWLNAVDEMRRAEGLSDAERAALGKLRDTIRYADPMSNEAAAGIEAGITESILGLYSAIGNGEALIADCEAICREIRHRNDVIRTAKA